MAGFFWRRVLDEGAERTGIPYAFLGSTGGGWGRTFAGDWKLGRWSGRESPTQFVQALWRCAPRAMLGMSSTRLVWYSLLAVASGLLGLALLPPILPAEMGSLLYRAFAPACHQLPGRSPHIGGVPIAICDRCTGIYAGLVVGVAVTGWGRGLWRELGRRGRYLLLGSLVPLGADWVGPVLGVWANGPLSRALTGLLFGVVAASYVTHRLLRRAAAQPGRGDGAGESFG